MRMIPTKDPLLRIVAILNFVDVLPGVLREGDVRAALRCVRARNASFNRSNAIRITANENAANLGLAAGSRMLANLPNYIAADANGGRVVFFLPGHYTTPFASGPSTASLSPSSKYPISRSELRATKISKAGKPS